MDRPRAISFAVSPQVWEVIQGQEPQPYQLHYEGVAQEQCRKVNRILGINVFRLLMAATCTLCCMGYSEPQDAISLERFRLWYR